MVAVALVIKKVALCHFMTKTCKEYCLSIVLRQTVLRDFLQQTVFHPYSMYYESKLALPYLF